MMTKRKTTAAMAVVALTLVGGGIAYAAWTKTGSGAGTSAAKSVGSASALTADTSTTPGAVILSWTAPSTSPATTTPTGYQVWRYSASSGPAGQTAVCAGALTSTAVTCTDATGTAGTQYFYTVAAVFTATGATAPEWTGAATSPRTSATPTSVGASKLVFTTAPSGSQTASSTATIGAYKVQEQDSSGNPVNAASTVTITLSTTSTGTTGNTPFFSTTSGGASPGTTTVTIATGQSTTGNFFYSDTKAGSPTLTAHVAGMTDATASPTVVAANVPLSFGPDCSTYSQQKSDKFSYNVTRAATDAFGNADPNAAQALTVTLATNGGSWSASSVVIPASSVGSPFATMTNPSGNGASVTLTGTPSLGGYSNATCTYATNNNGSHVLGAALLTSKTDTTANTHSTVTTSVTMTNGSNELILVNRTSNIGTDSITSISGPFTGVTALTSAGFQYSTDSYLWAYRAIGNGSGPVTVNFATGGNNVSTVVTVIQLSGSNTSAPVIQSVTNSGSSTSASGTLTTPNSGNGEINFVGVVGQPTIGSTESQIGTTATGTQGSGFTVATYFDTSAKTTETATLSVSKPWGTLAIELTHN